MPSVRLVIRNQRGLHARAAAKFVKLAGEFDAEIIVAKDGQVVSGVSILGLMLLAAALGEEIELTTSGEDEVAALAALSELVKNKFEEN
jgi:phosphocarrier protein